MTAPVFHDTIVLERTYDASPARVFDAFADPESRMRWGAPSKNTGLVFDETDFRVGGLDISRCGPVGNLIYRVDTRYQDIVPERRIISTEAVSQGPNLLSVSLITVEFEPAGNGTHLVLTDQIAAYGSGSMIAGSKAGFTAALDNLTKELEREQAGA